MFLNDNLKSYPLFNKLFSREYFVYFMIVMCFIKNVSVFQFGKIPMFAISIYAGALLVYWLIFDTKRIFSKQKILELLIILSCVISCFVNAFIGAYRDFTIFVSMLIAFLILSNVSEEDNIKTEIKNSSLLVMVLSFVYSTISLIIYIIHPNERFSGFTTIDIFSELLLTSLGVSSFCFVFFEDNKMKIFSIISFAFQFTLLFLNQQRTGVFGAIIAIVCVILFLKYLNSNKYLTLNFPHMKIILALIILTIIILFLILCSNASVLFAKIFRFSETARFQLIEVGISTLLIHDLLFGMSSGAMGVYMLEYLNDNPSYYLEGLHKVESVSYYSHGYVHNIYLYQLLSHGVIGFILLILYIFKVIKSYVFFFKQSDIDRFKIAFITSSFFILISQSLVGFVSMNVLFGFAYIPNILFFQYCGYVLLKGMKT